MDIVQELRERYRLDPTVQQAVDEIERMRFKHKEMVSKLQWVVKEYNDLLIEHKTTVEEATHLRKALQMAVDPLTRKQY